MPHGVPEPESGCCEKGVSHDEVSADEFLFGAPLAAVDDTRDVESTAFLI
jgi:hypothetical protein